MIKTLPIQSEPDHSDMDNIGYHIKLIRILFDSAKCVLKADNERVVSLNKTVFNTCFVLQSKIIITILQ